MALVTSNQFQLVPELSRAGIGFAQGQQIGQAFDNRRQQRQAVDQATATRNMQFVGDSIASLRALPVDLREGALQQLLPRLAEFGINTGALQGSDLSDNSLDQASAGLGRLKAKPPTEQFTLSQGQKRFQDGKVIAQVAPKVATEDQPSAISPLPESFTAGLPEDTAQKVRDTFTVAGGGKDGLKAVETLLKRSTEEARREAAPEIIKSSYPKASPAELEQLQATMDGAKTTESGLKATAKVREDQRRDKKAKAFQETAITLLDSILANPELNDVLGSIEGTDEGFLFGKKFRSDTEAEAIADIEEARNILTADNLNLMSGVLSETDIKILANLASGALTRTRSEASFRARVTRLREKLAKEAVTTIDDTTDFSTTSDDDLLRF